MSGEIGIQGSHRYKQLASMYASAQLLAFRYHWSPLTILPNTDGRPPRTQREYTSHGFIVIFSILFITFLSRF
jgi:hypothetical protein